MTTLNLDNLAELINADRVRSSVRRLFQNDIAECLSELFQNTQRARARSVEITTTEDGFTYRDDGHGLLGGVAGFHTLLKIAESHFDNDTIADQDPMGLGIHALLAHDAIERVTFASGHYQLTLKTNRWWTDRDYYTHWFKELAELISPITGFQITAHADATLVGSLKDALTRSTCPWYRTAPAEGYEGYLEITLDGQQVNTSLPRWARIEQPLIETTYQGSRLSIGFDCEYGSHTSSVNWYGQVIEVGFHSGFKFHLDVRQGRPVNPHSPTRRGLIKDAAHEALLRAVKDEVFHFVCNMNNRAQVKPEYVAALFRWDAERACRKSPYFVAAELLPVENPFSLEDLDCQADAELFTYDSAPRLLEEGVTVLTAQGETIEDERGLSSFVPLLGKCYALRHGERARLKIESLWWKPGKRVRNFFYEPGERGVVAGGEPPQEWLSVGCVPVFSFTDASNWDVAAVEWTVGTNDPVAFLRSEAWAGFDPEHDEHDEDELRAAYEESIERLLREVIGNCVPFGFTTQDLPSLMPTKEARIEAVRFHYSGEESKTPQEITATNAQGEEVRLRLL